MTAFFGNMMISLRDLVRAVDQMRESWDSSDEVARMKLRDDVYVAAREAHACSDLWTFLVALEKEPIR